MATTTTTASTSYPLLSPAELAYLHTSLSRTPPIRPDGRRARQFRPLATEWNLLPATNGSARVCFSDGSEAVVGVKAEVAPSAAGMIDDGGVDRAQADDSWVTLSIDIPGVREDDGLPVYLAAMLTEALVVSSAASAASPASAASASTAAGAKGGKGITSLSRKLYINRRFHWRLCIDILLLSPPLSYPLPLLSLTTHLALLATRIPRLVSEGEEDPVFDDDWEAAEWLYPRWSPRDRVPAYSNASSPRLLPPITLLVMAVGSTILFDPSQEELSVADMVLAISVAATETLHNVDDDDDDADVDVEMADDDGSIARRKRATKQRQRSMTTTRAISLLAIRTIDPPSRLTTPGVPDPGTTTSTTDATPPTPSAVPPAGPVDGVWTPPRGGFKRGLVRDVLRAVMGRGGVADEVFDGLEAVVVGRPKGAEGGDEMWWDEELRRWAC
ncbi:MAG: hypothetical protein M1826_002036 [Phylliscum demangeonii]|nr:MAG: hypothetical protein M1826_002036 [Phylliscum demangeonii]